MKWLLLLVVAAVGCSDNANTQSLPIGSRCSQNTQCGTSPYVCNMGPGYAFGYCEAPCTTDGDCPLDSLCSPAPVKACRRACKESSECRQSEGYACVLLPTGKSVCDTGPSMVDGGAP